MSPDKPYDEPSVVAAEDGEVVVDGPDGVAISFTPAAAVETSSRLMAASAQAQGQQAEAERRKREQAASANIYPTD